MSGILGRLDAIWIKRAHHGPMDSSGRATLEAGRGLAGNADQGGRRQVTIIDRQAWDRVDEELGEAVDPASRRANLMVSGISLVDSRGRTLRIGPCRLRIYGETRPCNLMEETFPGLRRALSPEWRGGVFATVEHGGEIAVGDAVEWEEASAPTA